MHYYNALPSPYHHRLEEKSIDNLGSSLHTCLEYEEQLERTSLPQGELVKHTYMSSFSPLELIPLLHHPLEVQLKIIFRLNLSCL
jgi:hypothetical protein